MSFPKAPSPWWTIAWPVLMAIAAIFSWGFKGNYASKAEVSTLQATVSAEQAKITAQGADSTTFTAATEKWTVLSTVYLYQYGGSPTINVTTLGDTVTFAGTTSSTSADSAVISVQPFVGGLVANITGEVI